MVGTPAYLAPELFPKYLYGQDTVFYCNKVDVFSLGATFWEMLFGPHFLWVKGQETVDAENLYKRIKENTGKNIRKNAGFERTQVITKGSEFLLGKMTEFYAVDRIDWATLFNENFWRYLMDPDCENFLHNQLFWTSVCSEEFEKLTRILFRGDFYFHRDVKVWDDFSDIKILDPTHPPNVFTDQITLENFKGKSLKQIAKKIPMAGRSKPSDRDSYRYELKLSPIKLTSADFSILKNISTPTKPQEFRVFRDCSYKNY